MKLSGNTVLITGGSSGIGLAMAKRFYRHHNTVIVCGRSTSALEQLSSEYEGMYSFSCDLTRKEDLQRLFNKMDEYHLEINVLVNNAGIQNMFDYVSAPPPFERLEHELDINLRVPLYLTQYFLPMLLSKPESAIINVSSGLAILPKRTAPVYCATKAALHSYSQSLRMQLEDTSVKVFEVLPPMVKTPMTVGRHGADSLTPDELCDAFFKAFARDQYEIMVGKTQQLYHLHRFFPALAKQIMRKRV